MSQFIATVRSLDGEDMTCRFEARSMSQAKIAHDSIEQFALTRPARELVPYGYAYAPRPVANPYANALAAAA